MDQILPPSCLPDDMRFAGVASPAFWYAFHIPTISEASLRLGVTLGFTAGRVWPPEVDGAVDLIPLTEDDATLLAFVDEFQAGLACASELTRSVDASAIAGGRLLLVLLNGRIVASPSSTERSRCANLALAALPARCPPDTFRETLRPDAVRAPVGVGVLVEVLEE